MREILTFDYYLTLSIKIVDYCVMIFPISEYFQAELAIVILHPKTNNSVEMKNLTIVMASLLLSLNLLSCSGKEDDPENSYTATEVSGIYGCSVLASAMGQGMSFEDVDVTLEVESDNAVRISVNSFGTPPMQLPDLNFGTVVVSGSNGHYSLNESEFSGITEDGKKYFGKIGGSVETDLNLQVELNYGTMPMPLMCTFTGKLK